jgi:hypothetical protein
MVRIFLLAAVLAGCSGTVLRDRDTYLTEVAFTDRLVREGAPATRDIVLRRCTCANGVWQSNSSWATDQLCQDYADWWTVYAVRWAWHRGMMLYNARLRETRPPTLPPLPPRSCELPDDQSE